MGVIIGGGVGISALAAGPLAIADGGTGQITAPLAFNALAPVQTGHTGQFLTTNGTNVSWVAVSSGGSSSGPVNTIQLSNGSGGFTAANMTSAAGVLAFTDITSSTITSADGPGGGNGINLTVKAGAGVVNSNGTNGGSLTVSAGNGGTAITGTGGNGGSVNIAAGGQGGGPFPGGAGVILFTTSGAERFRIRSDGGWSLGSGGTAIGTAGQVLTSNGGAVPTWTTIATNPDIVRTTVFDASAKGTRVVITAGVTIPDATYTPGTTFSFYNSTGAAITITQAAGLTLRLDGTALTGNRTLAAFGTCIVWYNTASEAIISGSVT